MEMTIGSDQYLLYAEACEYFVQGDFNLVLQMIDALPETTEINLLRGHSFTETERYSEAETEFRKVLERHQDNAESILGLACFAPSKLRLGMTA